MALKGTLKDFGIADILQLIGQQQKTGTLHIRSKGQSIRVGFVDGNIVKAESTTRNKKDLIGNMLVRAEVISETQLDAALETQKRSLTRLGDVLVSGGMISADRFKAVVQLQLTEALYRLFTWKSGNYDFEQGEVEYDAEAITPLRAETVLMEGFRRVDEWPLIRKKITSYQVTFETLKDLPPARPGEDEEAGGVGPNERRVHGLVAPGRDVRKLIDVSCLGEFDTCKALANLLDGDYLRAVSPLGKSERLSSDAGVGSRIGGVVGRVAITGLVVVGLAVLAWQIRIDGVRLGGGPASTFADPATQRFISRAQLSRIQAAVGIYRLEQGQVPETLDVLVDTGLLAREDLRYPWLERYYYRRLSPTEFILLPPLR